jgi:hypothetical protein
MTAASHERDDLALDADALAALQRFDGDARALCAACRQGAGAPHTMHIWATAAYRNALVEASHHRWQVFVRSVAALVAAPIITTSHSTAARAADRLRCIVEENADLLPADRR